MPGDDPPRRPCRAEYSQALTIILSRIVPRDQIVPVHAPLGEVEWQGTIGHIKATLPDGVPLIFAPVASGKTLLDRVEQRGKWPGIRQRWCTAETKRGPIERELRRWLKAHPRFGDRLVNAMGMRADESTARARKLPWRRNDRMSAAGRKVFDWLPIFDLSTEDVFRVIRDAGQSPHWIYDHLSRCSCSFCIFSSPEDLRKAAALRPGLYRRYARIEQRIGHTLSPTRRTLRRSRAYPLSLPQRRTTSAGDILYPARSRPWPWQSCPAAACPIGHQPYPPSAQGERGQTGQGEGRAPEGAAPLPSDSGGRP